MIVLVVATAIATIYARPRQHSSNAGTGGSISLEQLEQQIASGSAPTEVWSAYADRLFTAGQFDRAALAYEQVIEQQPSDRVARFQCALAWAETNNADRLLAFARDQLYFEPKLAAEILDRPECRRFLSDPRFALLQKDARAQAMD
jgi:hypothetical protein